MTISPHRNPYRQASCGENKARAYDRESGSSTSFGESETSSIVANNIRHSTSAFFYYYYCFLGHDDDGSLNSRSCTSNSKTVLAGLPRKVYCYGEKPRWLKKTEGIRQLSIKALVIELSQGQLTSHNAKRETSAYSSQCEH